MKSLHKRFFNRLFLIALLFINSVSVLSAQNTPSPLLVEARRELPKAFDDEKECLKLYDKLINIKNPDPLLKGYVGAVIIARAKHASLFDKKSYLSKGSEMLEQAISEKPNNTELLFLRLTIQIHLPSFLGYSDNLEADKKFVLKNYASTPEPLKLRIANFIKECSKFTEEEKAVVR